MRIAYVAIHLGEQIMRGGVGRKILSQAQLWGEFGHEARLFLHTPDELEFPGASIFRFQSGGSLPVWKQASRELARSRALARLVDAVAAYRPDVIYLRYGLYVPPLAQIFRMAPVILELNSRDLEEYSHRGRFYSLLNRFTRGVELNGSRAWAPVSEEIACFPENIVYKKNYRVIANGIDLSLFDPLPAPRNTRPRLVFIGSPGYNWHGVDKLPALARSCPDVEIDVVGYNASILTGASPENITFHGFLPQSSMRGILALADVALGSLALHRTGLQEASPLKTREALMFGLPLVLPYHDTDLSGKGLDFVLQIPNTEENLRTHAIAIRDFAYRMQGRRVDRSAVAPLIDQRVKEAARLMFFEQVRQGAG